VNLVESVDPVSARGDGLSVEVFRPVQGLEMPPEPSNAPIVLFMVGSRWVTEVAGWLADVGTNKVPTTEDRLRWLVQQLGMSGGPFGGATFANAIGWYWRPIELGGRTRTTSVTASMVLNHLRGSGIKGKRGGVRRILYGRGLPYCIGPEPVPTPPDQLAPREAQEFRHADVLPVVVSWDWESNGPPVEGHSLGNMPYFLALGNLPTAEDTAPGAPAFALAKALCKVLGLGDEGDTPETLSAPDYWGRAFPNLWASANATDATCPWRDLVDGNPKFVPGGFGVVGGMFRPTADCLMGRPLGVGGADLCVVCNHHLESILPRPVPDGATPTRPNRDPMVQEERIVVKQGLLGSRRLLGAKNQPSISASGIDKRVLSAGVPRRR